MVGTINQSESCTEVQEVRTEGCAEVCGEVHGGAQKCMEVFQRAGGEKNQDFMLIRFLNDGV